MTQIIIDTNIDDVLNKLDYKLAKRIDKAVISKVTLAVKKDVKMEAKKLLNGSERVKKFITSKITNNNIGLIRASYIARWQNTGTKTRQSRKPEGYLYFESYSGLIRKKMVKGITGKHYMERANDWVSGGKYNDLVDKAADSVLKKVLGE